METGNETQVQVRFFTNKSQHVVIDTPFAVPSTLSRYGLSEIINHLIEREGNPIPFDFLINGNYIRTSLAQYIKQHAISSEQVIDIEYIEAQVGFARDSDVIVDDWVSSLNLTLQRSTDDLPYLLVGDYSGRCHLISFVNSNSNNNDNENSQPKEDSAKDNSKSNKKSKKSKGKDANTTTEDTTKRDMGSESQKVELTKLDQPISCALPIFKGTKESRVLNFLTASKDATARLFRYQIGGDQKADIVSEFVGHTGTINCVDINPDSTKFCTASWDKTIQIWDLEGSLEESESMEVDDGEGKSKKRKRADREVKQVSAKGIVRGHTDAVSGVVWGLDHTIYSAGWDHTVRVWDVLSTVAPVNTYVLNGSKVASHVSFNKFSQLLLTAHNDGFARVWDSRVKEGNVCQNQFRAHKGWCRTAMWWDKFDYQNQFLTAGDDGVVRMWDLRAKQPLLSTKHLVRGKTTNRIFSIAAHIHDDDKRYVYSGSDDSLVRKHSLL